MAVLVTGGAGYIGSFVLRALAARGIDAVVLDDLSTGHRRAADGWPLEVHSCGDSERVAALMERAGIDAVIHLAALSIVGDSVREPERYWRHNVGGAEGLLTACRKAGVRRFVLSSTAAVYGEPSQLPIPESHPLSPTNPYGDTKVEIERRLAQAQASDGLAWAALRYFNAAGAMPDGSLGEDHPVETHLIPLALRAAATGGGGDGTELTVFGDDWPTPDGTCLRDYVHVLDLARAHVLALDWLDGHPGGSLVCNLGGGEGTSVRQVLDAVRRATGREVPHRMGPRRAGDPAVLVAAVDRAAAELGWRPERSDIARVVEDAWAWERRRGHAAP
ncbi:MAG: UDP-glucose 4-epimerase GalE [Acidobacteria bacterium]|jgi:UDP-glucose-4-epimerase GalE|nr:UDP-glucose 4-epimerase GalE [Acidobacteriota bacterium]